MRNMFKGLLALALTFGVAAGQAQAQSETLLTDVTIVDVAGGTLAPGQSVLIRDGLIVGGWRRCHVGFGDPPRRRRAAT